MKKLILLLLIVTFGLKANSQNFGEILGRSLGQVGEAILLKKIIENPNLQSADMQNYIYYLNSGHQSYNSANYGEEVSYYSKASNIIISTRDQNLLKLYNNYGWGKVLSDSYNNAYAKYKLTNPTVPQNNTSNSYSSSGYSSGGSSYSGGTINNYSSGSKTSTSSQGYQKTAHPRKCNKCLGRGTCGMCHGSGTYYVMAGKNSKNVTCPHCGGTGKCQICMGSGTNGVDYY